MLEGKNQSKFQITAFLTFKSGFFRQNPDLIWINFGSNQNKIEIKSGQMDMDGPLGNVNLMNI